MERAKSDERIKVFMLEKIREHEDTYDENNIRDFIDLYIQVARDEKEETKETFTGKNTSTYANTKIMCIYLNVLGYRISFTLLDYKWHIVYKISIALPRLFQ